LENKDLDNSNQMQRKILDISTLLLYIPSTSLEALLLQCL